MTTVSAVASRLLVLGLTLVLSAYALVSYPLPLVAEITAGTFLLVVVLVVGSHLLDRKVGGLPDLVSLFVIVFSATSTIQTLMAREVYGSLQALDATPGYALVVYVLHLLVVASVVLAGRERGRLVGLGAAIVYTSILYLPTFATLEAGPPFTILVALGLVLLVTAPTGQTIPLVKPFLLLALVALVATLPSYARYESLIWNAKLLTLGSFMLATLLTIQTRVQWKQAAFLIVVMSIAVPVLLSAAKLLALTWQVDFWSAIHYRMGLTELGRSNLIARSLMIGTPLLVSIGLTARIRIPRVFLWGLTLMAVLIFVSCQSWGGWVGASVTLLVFLAAAYGKRFVNARRKHHLLAFVLAMLILVSGLAFLWLAIQVNVTSFNGRLIHFRLAADQIIAHPLLGVGPGHNFLNAHHAGTLQWLADSQYSQDHPLWVLSVLSIFPLFHSHNLLLEVSAGLGLLGLSAFLWLLVEFFRFGLATRRNLQGPDRVLLTGCLVGIVAAAGWGLLDVMEISPPFFTFPTWALVGLVLAAPRAFGIDERRKTMDKGQRTEEKDSSFVLDPSSCCRPSLSRNMQHTPRMVFCGLCFGLALIAVVASLLANLHYRSAYASYQERRWDAAVEELMTASLWEPLNARYHQMRGEALTNLGRYEQAVVAYERVVRLTRDFAPYHTQLGWNYWLQGDLETATAHFQEAVEMDPREAWRDGLHADLGLAYVNQGRLEEAIPLFKKTIELDPQMALAPYWMPMQRADGSHNILLDPVYQAGYSPELEKRILARLGKADYTSRVFDPSSAHAIPSSSLSLGQVLDAIEADYQAAHAAGGREAPHLLATVAEAARVTGLEARAERTYLAFQKAFPESAYGFRDLGRLYREQGRLQEAQEQLEQAVQVSPRDTASWLELAQVYLTGGMLDEAQAALDTVYKQRPLEPGLYELGAQLQLQKGKTAKAVDALGKALVIVESIPNRLALAKLYRELGDQAQASEQCTAALGALLRTRPRPLDPALWDIGVCLAQSPGEDVPEKTASLASEQPLTGNVLLGHIYRARGQLEQALTAYQAAADTHPDEGAPHYFLGETYEALGQPGPAQVEYRRAVQLGPLESLPLLALGRLQWSQDQQDEAIESFDAAVETTPGWSQAQVALGNALLAIGDRQGAAQHFELALMAAGDIAEGQVYDFAAHLAEAEIASPDPDYVRNSHFTISGDELRLLFMHPDSSARYIVDVPAGSILVFDVATDPGSWDQPGDGVTFAIYVESDQAVKQIFSTYIDPKQDAAARRWHPHTVDLEAYAGQTVTIVFETGTGPAGDYRFDWAGWGAPRLLKP
ncbi:tetratricopeptide repeat protein [Chloroflexota bacterium]